MSSTTTTNPLLGPGLEPPPGVIPNFTNPPDTQRTAFIVTLVLCLSVTSVFVPLRLYTKLFIVKKPQWEDCKYSETSTSIVPSIDQLN